MKMKLNVNEFISLEEMAAKQLLKAADEDLDAAYLHLQNLEPLFDADAKLSAEEILEKLRN